MLDILPTSRLGLARAVAFDGVLPFFFRGLPLALVLHLRIFVDLPLLFCIFLWLLRTPFLTCLLLCAIRQTLRGWLRRLAYLFRWR